MVVTPGIRPNLQLVANGNDISSLALERFVSLRLTDGTGFECDELELVFADTDPSTPFRKPPPGAEVRPFLGYDGTFVDMGLFVADEIELGLWPGRWTVHCRSAVYAPTPAGKTGLQTQYSQTWANGVTIGALVQTIAARHGMTAAVSASLAGIALPHITQEAESDLNLLTRIAQKYDAVFKPANGQILFYPRGTGQTVSGTALPAITLQPTDITELSYNEQTRQTAGTVVATYHEPHTAGHHVVSVGSGDPVRRLRMGWSGQSEALAAAKAALAQLARNQNRLTISLPGDPTIAAEYPLNLVGFHPDLPTAWIIGRVTHSLSVQGWRCEIEAQLPNNPELATVQSDAVV